MEELTPEQQEEQDKQAAMLKRMKDPSIARKTIEVEIVAVARAKAPCACGEVLEFDNQQALAVLTLGNKLPHVCPKCDADIEFSVPQRKILTMDDEARLRKKFGLPPAKLALPGMPR